MREVHSSVKYLNYINSNGWKRLRREKLKLSGNRCEVCQRNTGKPHVHHVVYRFPLETGVIGDLRVMCDSCHNALHDLLRAGQLQLRGGCEARWNRTLAALKPLALNRQPRGNSKRAKWKERKKIILHQRRVLRRLKAKRSVSVKTVTCGASQRGFAPPQRVWDTRTALEREAAQYAHL